MKKFAVLFGIFVLSAPLCVWYWLMTYAIATRYVSPDAFWGCIVGIIGTTTLAMVMERESVKKELVRVWSNFDRLE